jgi:hypothetical protein
MKPIMDRWWYCGGGRELEKEGWGREKKKISNSLFTKDLSH